MSPHCPASIYVIEYYGGAISFPAECRFSMVVLNHFTMIQSSPQFTEGCEKSSDVSTTI